jgi:glycosyltransferase involved in cell wall biosynthesis
VYNGLNHPYRSLPPEIARLRLLEAGLPAGERRGLLHVGGGQWYKNDLGVVHLYRAYLALARRDGLAPPALWMISPPPRPALRTLLQHLPEGGEVKFFSGLDTLALEALYSHAEALLFPSLAEGFGWPIVEALACGCPVITTAQAPMNEVGGDVVDYLPRLGRDDDPSTWAQAGASLLARVLARSSDERERRSVAGQVWAARFSADTAIENYLTVYQRVLSAEIHANPGLAHAARR